MIIIPAIDLKDHKVVRLSQGRMGEAKVYSDNPVEVAKKWIDQGAKRIHVVDLNGAFEGRPIHFKEVKSLVESFPDIQFEIGGGIRTMETVDSYMSTGVQFCILGTAAVNDPEFVKKACEKYQGRILLGIDTKKGQVTTDGWNKKSGVRDINLSKEFGSLGIPAIIYTDIAKDGMLSGINLSATRQMANKSPIPIIASGGLTSIDEIKELKKIKNVIGVIAGKVLYEGKMDLAEAIKIAST